MNKSSFKILLHCAGLINYANAGAFKAATQNYAQFGFLLQKVMADLRV